MSQCWRHRPYRTRATTPTNPSASEPSDIALAPAPLRTVGALVADWPLEGLPDGPAAGVPFDADVEKVMALEGVLP